MPLYFLEHEQIPAEFVWIFSFFKAELTVEIDCCWVRGLNFSVGEYIPIEGGTLASLTPSEHRARWVRKQTTTYNVKASPSVSVLAYSTIRRSSARIPSRNK
jgi:hypothetical protein